MWTKGFWLATLERAIKTFAQAFVAAVIASQVTGVVDLDWSQNASVAGLATLLSVLTSIAAGAKDGSPSLANEVALDPAPLPATDED